MPPPRLRIVRLKNFLLLVFFSSYSYLSIETYSYQLPLGFARRFAIRCEAFRSRLGILENVLFIYMYLEKNSQEIHQRVRFETSPMETVISVSIETFRYGLTLVKMVLYCTIQYHVLNSSVMLVKFLQRSPLAVRTRMQGSLRDYFRNAGK